MLETGLESLLEKKKKTMTHENLTLCKPIFVFFKGQGSKIKKKKNQCMSIVVKKLLVENVSQFF